jgi:diguanylate cyclase (GGDEF)-like protein
MDKELDFKITEELFKQLFDHYRYVDPETHTLIEGDFGHDETKTSSAHHCYEIWSNELSCVNCISKKAYNEDKSYSKIVYQNGKASMVTALPIVKDGKKMVIELFKDITNTGLVEIEKKSEGLIVQVIEEMHSKANRDSLTGAYNGRYATEQLPMLIKTSHKQKLPISLIFVSINNILAINKTYGFKIGDDVLKHVGRLMIPFCLHQEDFLARYHGLRFILVLNNTDEKEAYKTTRRLFKKITSTKLIIGNTDVKFSINIGSYTNESEIITAADFIKNAQNNVYINSDTIAETLMEPKQLQHHDTTFLTLREKDVADLVLSGMGNSEISHKLYISEPTVKKHISKIFEKSLVRSRAEFISKFSRKPV